MVRRGGPKLVWGMWSVWGYSHLSERLRTSSPHFCNTRGIVTHMSLVYVAYLWLPHPIYTLVCWGRVRTEWMCIEPLLCAGLRHPHHGPNPYSEGTVSPFQECRNWGSSGFTSQAHHVDKGWKAGPPAFKKEHKEQHSPTKQVTNQTLNKCESILWHRAANTRSLFTCANVATSQHTAQ